MLWIENPQGRTEDYQGGWGKYRIGIQGKVNDKPNPCFPGAGERRLIKDDPDPNWTVGVKGRAEDAGASGGQGPDDR